MIMNSLTAANFSSSTPSLPLKRFPNHVNHNRRVITVNAKQGENDDQEKSSIDKNMVVLRMRIKNMKVLESKNNEAGRVASLDWLEWEKKVFTRYHENVCDSMEMLQTYLMNTRPSVALGTLMLVAMSVPFSTSVVMVNALKVAKGLLAGCHVCIDIDF